MEKNVYEIEPGRWGYTLPGIIQEWAPDKEGFVPMSDAEANAYADEVLARLE